MTSRADCLALDRLDPLASLRDQFTMPDGVVYLDGNSLGPMPAATPARLQQVITEQWATDLISSWNTHSWMQLPQQIGNAIAPLVGAGPNELIVSDSTSIDLFKVLTAAVVLQHERASGRNQVVSIRLDFPTDLYIAESVAAANGMALRLVDDWTDDLIDEHTAVVLLSHVDYRSGALRDMAAVCAAARAADVLTVWDLSHSVGALPVDLTAAGADFAVGCGYKYLNGGPGAPAFVWVRPELVGDARQPLRGWLGHAAPFAFEPDYRAAPGIDGYLCGTPPILSMAALSCGVDTVSAAEPLGGMPAIREKSGALTDLMIALIDPLCAAHELDIITPRERHRRGSHIALTHPTGAFEIVQALIANRVVGDFRAPDIARFGVSALHTRYVDIWDAVDRLRTIVETGVWREPQFTTRATVT